MSFTINDPEPWVFTATQMNKVSNVVDSAMNNHLWTQCVHDVFNVGRAKFLAALPPSHEPIWVALKPQALLAIAQYTMSRWCAGIYPGSHNNKDISQYESDTLQSLSDLTREQVAKLIICEYITAMANYRVSANGRLYFTFNKGKGGNITFYVYYRGNNTPLIRVKPAHQEKWERLTEHWETGNWTNFRKSSEAVAHVYRMYKAVMNTCAEHARDKELNGSKNDSST